MFVTLLLSNTLAINLRQSPVHHRVPTSGFKLLLGDQVAHAIKLIGRDIK